jgi:ubiquinone/menaquinone biosynthesis C-methylase UbiE
MAQLAREHVGDAVEVQEATWIHLPYANASKDIVVGRSSLQYEHDIDAAYREAARVLKLGGTLILVVPHPDKAQYRTIEVHDGREYVHDVVHGGTTPITYPRHFEEEYFSRTFAELFDLREKEVFKKERNGRVELDQLAFVAVKR